MDDPGGIERLLRREQAIVGAALTVLCLLAWVYVVSGVGLGMSALEMAGASLFPHQGASAPSMPDMPGMDMSGMDMSDAPPDAPWSNSRWLLTIAMWCTMMVAMMIPAATPMILLYARVRRRAQLTGEAGGVAPMGAFAAAYLLVWFEFGLIATIAQFALERAGLLSATTMGSASRWLSAAVLIGAGIYQLTPLRTVCLNHCRSPASFLSQYWRPGLSGALRLGVIHGAYCLGCCWFLMALLFVGGMMNLTWIAAISVLVLAEKLTPNARWITYATAGLLILWGIATLIV